MRDSLRPCHVSIASGETLLLSSPLTGLATSYSWVFRVEGFLEEHGTYLCKYNRRGLYHIILSLEHASSTFCVQVACTVLWRAGVSDSSPPPDATPNKEQTTRTRRQTASSGITELLLQVCSPNHTQPLEPHSNSPAAVRNRLHRAETFD